MKYRQPHSIKEYHLEHPALEYHLKMKQHHREKYRKKHQESKQTRRLKKMKIKKTLLSLVAGTLLVPGVAFSKYECQGSGMIVGQEDIFIGISRMHEDIDNDGKADKTVLYIFNDCLRKLREHPYNSETREEQLINDKKSVLEYFKYKKQNLKE